MYNHTNPSGIKVSLHISLWHTEIRSFGAPLVSSSQRSRSNEVGQPHQWALEEQKRLIKEKAEAAKALSAAVGCCGWASPAGG